MSTITVTPIAGSLGAEVRGVDLRRMDNHDWAQVHQAFLDYKVIAIRDQELSEQEMMDVGARFGEPNHYPFVRASRAFRSCSISSRSHPRPATSAAAGTPTRPT